MQRYGLTERKTTGEWHIAVRPLDDGEYVLHSDALAEIAAAEQRGAERAAAYIEAQAELVDSWHSYFGGNLRAMASVIRRGDHHAHGHPEIPK